MTATVRRTPREHPDPGIHDRALILKQLAQYLGEHKEELYEISYATGATAKDHLIDIDGGIGTLFTFSSQGRRELPHANVIVDGAVEQLSRDGSFLGEHVYTRVPGVAVQINAFNFPVWGMLEKFAPAFIAGVPTIVKPATPTGYVTEACARLMLGSGLLPEGSLQLISGSARDLLEQLDARDHVAFTGSAATARSLRPHNTVQEKGVRFTAETDSLNAAVMAPDVTEDSPEFEAFVKSVVLEITAKGGQKCTAIRRVIVPQALKPAVIAALRERVAQRAVVGDPRDATTVSPLASEDQHFEVLRSVRALIDAGATVELGGPEELASLPDQGAFFPVTVLSFDDARTPAVHALEAFGPVTSVLGYSGDIADAVEIAALGGGSLVATVCTHSPELAAQFASGIGAHHGRVLFPDRDDAKTSTGHGSPVPHLVHGGTEEHPFRKSLQTLRIGASSSRTCARSPSRTTWSSRRRPGTRSTPTRTRKPPWPTRSSPGGWPTATCWSHGPRGSSWSPPPGRYSPTTGWRTCGSSPPSRMTTPSGSP